MTMSNSAEGLNEDKPLISGSNNHVVRRVVKVTLLFMGIAVLAFVIHNNANPFASFLRTSYYFHPPISAASLLSSSSSVSSLFFLKLSMSVCYFLITLCYLCYPFFFLWGINSIVWIKRFKINT